jgi:hypothetical protein
LVKFWFHLQTDVPCFSIVFHYSPHPQHDVWLSQSALGSAIAQVVSRRLPTAAARVRCQVRLCGICGEQSGTGTGFLRVLRFPLQILIPPTAPHSSSYITGVGTIGQTVADVPRGLGLTPPKKLKKKSALPTHEECSSFSCQTYWEKLPYFRECHTLNGMSFNKFYIEIMTLIWNHCLLFGSTF